jgi:hypothetical protein
MRHTTFAAFALSSSALLAQSVVVPNAQATTVGTGGTNTLVRNAGNPRSFQQGILASQLANVPVGAVITGISLRFSLSPSNSPTWPPQDIQWTAYDIYQGPAAPLAGWVADPALNFSSPPVQVRSGPMTLDAGSFIDNEIAGVPNPFSEFYFDFKNPQPYLGGDLAFLFSHPGSLDPTAAQFPETVASSAAVHGVGRTQSVYPAGVASVAGSFFVMRVHYGYGAGCPGSSGTPPVMVHNGDTTGGLGGTWRFTLANTPANSLVVFGFGFSQLSVPFGPCTLLISPDILLAGLSNANGRAVQTVTVPPGFVGGFFTQGVVLDPAAPGGLVFSNGVSPAAN